MKTLFIVAFIWFTQNCYAQQDSLVWSDEFNGSGALNPVNWTFDLGSNGWGNNEIQEYTNSTKNARQESGVLVIEALKTGNAWTSARVVSKGLHNFTYGRVVFRAKVPAGTGSWPALWMLGENASEVGWPACGEIDVMEHQGKYPGIIHATIHVPAGYGDEASTGILKIDSYNTEFHLYEANWKPDCIEFSIDNVLTHVYKPEVKNSSTWPLDKPFYIIMNIAMGGNWGSDLQFETNGLKNGIAPAISMVRMEVDYVRVYKQ